MSFPVSQRGRRVRAICGDGLVRSVVITAAFPWAWDAISASAQVTVSGARFTLSGNLSAVGVTDSALYRHAAPEGVAFRFHSSALTSVCGCTPHRPVAPALRKAAARCLGRFASLPGFLAWYCLADDLRAVAAERGLVTAQELPPLLEGRFWKTAVRAALARIKPEPLARMARLAWAFRCWQLDAASRAQGTEGRAWDGHRI